MFLTKQFQPMKIKNLTQLIIEQAKKLGDNAPEFFGAKPDVIEKWISGKKAPGIEHAQALLESIPEDIELDFFLREDGDADEPPVAEKIIRDEAPISPAPSAPVGKSRIAICVPVMEGLAPLMSVLGNWKSTIEDPAVRDSLAKLFVRQNTVIHHARNLLAAEFLNSGADWSIWFDADMIVPFGNPNWFRDKTRTSRDLQSFSRPTIEALTCHKGAGVVSAVYAARDGSGRIVAHCGMSDNGDKALVEKIKAGPSEGLVEQKWIGFGCMAVHRRVFEDIKAKCPEIAPQSGSDVWGFFNPEQGPTSQISQEDIAFCVRANKAGHKVYLDLSVHAAHIGKLAFMP